MVEHANNKSHLQSESIKLPSFNLIWSKTQRYKETLFATSETSWRVNYILPKL